MNLRERSSHDPVPTTTAPALSGGGGFRAAAERLLAQGADAIDRVLSQDSAAFNRANRQKSGQ